MSTTEYFQYSTRHGSATAENEIWKITPDHETEALFVSSTWSNDKLAISIDVPKPVYVETIDDEDQLIYNSRIMELDKIYKIKFNNEFWALCKTEKNIEFFKFDKDE